jgi:hypothetical protein
MNQPQQPWPGQYQQPGQFPNQPMPPPQQQWQNAPLNQPQQQFQQQGLPPVQPQNPGQAAVGGQAAANLFVSFLQAPPKPRFNREKPDDGVHVVRFTAESKVDFSQKSGQQYLLVSYQVVESTVSTMVQKSFGYPMYFTTRNQLEDLAEFCKVLYGAQGLQNLINSGRGAPALMADAIVATLRAGIYCGLETKHSQSQMKKGIPYAECFVNHYWSNASAQPFPLSTLRVAQQPQQQQQYAPPGTPPQLPPGYQQGMPQQAPMMPQQAPMMPQQPQQPYQQPQQAPMMPQQPMMPQMPGQPMQPQSPLPPQPMAQAPQQMPPPPAVFVPPPQPGAFPGQR